MTMYEPGRSRARLRHLVIQLAAALPLAAVIYVASGSLALAACVAALDVALRPVFAAGLRRVTRRRDARPRS